MVWYSGGTVYSVYRGSTIKETMDLLLGQPPKEEFIEEIRDIVTLINWYMESMT